MEPDMTFIINLYKQGALTREELINNWRVRQEVCRIVTAKLNSDKTKWEMPK